jgi:hypothetical protein
VCEMIWCKKIQADGKPCNTVNYLDPYCFWNWKGNTHCAQCGTVYYIHLINGQAYEGPTEQPAGTKVDVMPLYADRPLEGYSFITMGTEGKTRPFECLPRHFYLGVPDMTKFSIRNRPVRGWRPQPPDGGIACSYGFNWDIKRLSPDVWEEYQRKIKDGEVTDW